MYGIVNLTGSFEHVYIFFAEKLIEPVSIRTYFPVTVTWFIIKCLARILILDSTPANYFRFNISALWSVSS